MKKKTLKQFREEVSLLLETDFEDAEAIISSIGGGTMAEAVYELSLIHI